MELGERHGIYHGTVIDRTDPLKLGRVRIAIPGVVDESAWAFPAATGGGGSAGRGFFVVPELHADVMVMFVLGDPDRPVYLSGHWGTPGGTPETPSYLAGKSQDDTPKIRVFETEKFLLVFDDVADVMILQEKASGVAVKIFSDKIQFGAGATEPFVLGTVWKTMMGALIDLIVAHQHPTAVGPSGPPLTAAAFTAIKTGQLDPCLSQLVFGKMSP